MASKQTLSDPSRRVLARWAADCAERVLPLFDADPDADPAAGEQVRDALARTRAYSTGQSTAAEEISKRLGAAKAASAAASPAGAAAARAVGQAAAVAHMGAHALGAAAYAAKAVSLAHPDRPEKVAEEVRWQLARLTTQERSLLRELPPLGADPSGPLGEGLLSRGILGSVIRQIQDDVARS
ncbi:hypothetical protein LEP48_03480 [Isoptericola sp. NEAU-Y5]|uniref:Imm-5-like domain-containing protein n=1 Tax=Isoptericola luteus TaxID=2879484 RepID=A0ABS7ZF15_9MICO|nr:hypothetical protein [Isoptericola sp. NEAU-Y5]MCA5892414.1 hypothetical protein [Isoptericola sp. NEAU-Y5]